MNPRITIGRRASGDLFAIDVRLWIDGIYLGVHRAVVELPEANRRVTPGTIVEVEPEALIVPRFL